MSTLLVSTLCACGGGLTLRERRATVEPPGKLVVVFDVSASDGPVAGLEASHFTVFEGPRQLDPSEMAVDNPDLRDQLHTLLLLDMSRNPSAEDKQAMAVATKGFVAKLPPKSRIGVYAFDGDPAPTPIVAMTRVGHLTGQIEGTAPPPEDKPGMAQAGEPPAADAAEPPLQQDAAGAPAAEAEAAPSGSLDDIATFTPRDPSRDLHGSYKVAMQVMEQQLAATSAGPMAIGAIVLVTRGPDLAGRVGRLDMKQALDAAGARFTRIGVAVGTEAIEAPLGMFSDWDMIEVLDMQGLALALLGTADRLDALGRSHYVVGACSAARAGPQTLRIEARRNLRSADGRERTQSGSLRYQFDATGFGPGCNPSVTTSSSAAPESP